MGNTPRNDLFNTLNPGFYPRFWWGKMRDLGPHLEGNFVTDFFDHKLGPIWSFGMPKGSFNRTREGYKRALQKSPNPRVPVVTLVRQYVDLEIPAREGYTALCECVLTTGWHLKHTKSAIDLLKLLSMIRYDRLMMVQ